MNFAELQRMYLRALQIDLVNIVTDLQFKNAIELETLGVMSKMDSTLRTYIQAVRDHKYMTDAAQTAEDPFIVSSERGADCSVLEHAMTRARKGLQELDPEFKKEIIPTGPWSRVADGEDALPIGGTRHESLARLRHHDFSLRALAGALGAAFLIGPMWLLALKPDLVFDLAATTVCVTLFGLLLAVIVEKPDQVFAGTLAYAAVLMVFVGVIIQETSG
ncbi:Uu.00g033830.m01.CDS01 [Anthostomella pinea]|uniref:Uu.00g033830.m01.CDS01 n=1 Tax=Anthostomella pinea TaxID=933095 RepID=A0AAI8V9Y0_9PEZI|nr:Uu.00g033830.m01.CDS01 [Anthostomella pinea]